MANVASNFEFIASLPPSTHPWKIHTFDHGIVLANPEHEPRIIRKNGTIDILKIPTDVVKTEVYCQRKIYVA